ncbi:Gustatory receptor 4 [Hyalella azteca]|uniref:Gustatory receptor 4 n=1 Tax=Hyalella azteca TaxID=294128 RepID=A0A6A0GT59_HYAAZ|nr:Gustatory receptor 4 [Hyalella azteca]
MMKINLQKLFNFSVWSLGFFGAFYSKKDGLARVVVSNSRNTPNCQVPKMLKNIIDPEEDRGMFSPVSLYCILWKICISTIIIAYFVVSTLGIMSSCVYFGPTLEFAFNMNKCIDTAAILILCIYIQINGRSLKLVVISLNQSLEGVNESLLHKKSISFIISIAGLIPVSIFLASVHILHFWIEGNMVSVAELFTVTAFTKLKLTFCCLYWSGTSLFEAVYDSVINKIRNRICQPEEKEDVSPSIPVASSHRGAVCKCYTMPDRGRNCEKSKGISTNGDAILNYPDDCCVSTCTDSFEISIMNSGRLPAVLNELRNSYGTILKVYKARKQLQLYMGVPIVLIMLYMVCTAIISAFLFFLMKNKLPFVSIVTIAYLALTMAVGNILLGVPDILLKKLHNLRELLAVDPGFTVCGLFTLSRFRIVDISCFVATYLIILVQFQTSEDILDASNSTSLHNHSWLWNSLHNHT